ncbi:MAG: hypothetical protein LBL00_05025, partial [Endomicrobium sp.]|nr:hypothetical protein [Endomicrobium sp.]
MKQYTAIITSILFLFSCFNGYCAVAAGSSPNVSTNSFSVPKQFGFVSDSFILSNNNRLVILIQDLHNDKETQTNIKNIISDVDKNYGFDNIFIEGLYNNPVWLAK